MATYLKLALQTIRKTNNLRVIAKRCHQHAFSSKYLLITNVSISVSLSAAGDVLEQQIEKHNMQLDKWDAERTYRMGVAGGVIGIICHYWYVILEKRLPSRSLKTVAQKIFLDQIICSPAYISAFFITMGYLENKSHQDVWEEIKTKAVRLYAADWVVWPMAQFINFYWLPMRYRVLYDSLISLGYDVYTSHVKHES